MARMRRVALLNTCARRVIASMHHKLNFLRNPRYPLPPSVKLLQSQFQPGPTWGSATFTSEAGALTKR